MWPTWWLPGPGGALECSPRLQPWEENTNRKAPAGRGNIVRAHILVPLVFLTKQRRPVLQSANLVAVRRDRKSGATPPRSQRPEPRFITPL